MGMEIELQVRTKTGYRQYLVRGLTGSYYVDVVDAGEKKVTKCTCPAYLYDTSKLCKHVREVLKMDETSEEPDNIDADVKHVLGMYKDGKLAGESTLDKAWNYVLNEIASADGDRLRDLKRMLTALSVGWEKFKEEFGDGEGDS